MFCNIHKTKILHWKEINQINPKGNHWKDSVSQWSKWMNQRNQWLKYPLKGLMLKFQYFGHLMRRTDSLETTLMLGKIESRRRRGQQRMRWLVVSPNQWTWICANTGRWWRIEESGVLRSMGSQRVGHNLVTKQQQKLKSEITA